MKNRKIFELFELDKEMMQDEIEQEIRFANKQKYDLCTHRDFSGDY